MNSLLINEYPLIEFGFSFISNAFAFQINMNSLLMNEYPLVEFGFPLATNDIFLSNNTYFIVNQVKRLLDYNRKITDIVCAQMVLTP